MATTVKPELSRADLEKATTAAMKAAQQPAGDLRDLGDEQLRFVLSYWSQRPRPSNDETLASVDYEKLRPRP